MSLQFFCLYRASVFPVAPTSLCLPRCAAERARVQLTVFNTFSLKAERLGPSFPRVFISLLKWLLSPPERALRPQGLILTQTSYLYQRKAPPHSTASDEHSLASFHYSLHQNVGRTPCAKRWVRAGDPRDSRSGLGAASAEPGTSSSLIPPPPRAESLCCQCFVSLVKPLNASFASYAMFSV